MTISRRDFLARSLAGSTVLASGLTLPGFLRQTAAASRGFGPGRETILVVVEMNGGNDGLNTVIPYRSDDYYRARPTIALPRPTVLGLDDELAFHPRMGALRKLYEEGWVTVCENVGYPNPDRSHFRSMDIWQSAVPCPEESRTGWLGRVADGKTAPGGAPFALHLDHTALPVALRTEHQPIPSIQSIDAFRLADGADLVESIAPDASHHADLQFVRRTMVSSCKQARRLEDVKRAVGEREQPYPDFGLARRLRQVAELIGAEFGPRVYYTSMGGFDTHAQQLPSHAALLGELADSVGAFFADLRARRLHERVLVMTFSEFGRRVEENGSQGTDHGAAAPMFLIGPGVRGGIIGGAPDLRNLGRGDLAHAIDFRQVYASVLESWLAVPPSPILGRAFKPVDVFGRPETPTHPPRGRRRI